jgi:hypothetical protein
MEHNPLIQLTALFESRGYVGREAVEEAEFELAQRQRERELHSKLYRVDGTTLLSLVPALFSTVVNPIIVYAAFARSDEKNFTLESIAEQLQKGERKCTLNLTVRQMQGERKCTLNLTVRQMPFKVCRLRLRCHCATTVQ